MFVAHQSNLSAWADRLTHARMVSAPVLLAAAMLDAPRVFVVVAACGFLSDALDGPLARAAHSASPRGAALDSRADVALCVAMLIGLAILLPAPFRAERVTLVVVVSAYVVPIAVGWLKFRTLTAYHTILARVSLVVLPLSVVLWLAWQTAWPVHAAAALLTLSAVEELAITLMLPAPRHDVPHLFSSAIHASPSRPEP